MNERFHGAPKERDRVRRRACWSRRTKRVLLHTVCPTASFNQHPPPRRAPRPRAKRVAEHPRPTKQRAGFSRTLHHGSPNDAQRRHTVYRGERHTGARIGQFDRENLCRHQHRCVAAERAMQRQQNTVAALCAINVVACSAPRTNDRAGGGGIAPQRHRDTIVGAVAVLCRGANRQIRTGAPAVSTSGQEQRTCERDDRLRRVPSANAHH